MSDLQVEVDTLQEGQPKLVNAEQCDQVLQQIESDCQQVVKLALKLKKQQDACYKLPAIANVSLVLCDDSYIKQLNQQYRWVPKSAVQYKSC